MLMPNSRTALNLEEKPTQANLEFVNIRDAYPDSPIPDGSNDQEDLDPYGDEE